PVVPRPAPFGPEPRSPRHGSAAPAPDHGDHRNARAGAEAHDAVPVRPQALAYGPDLVPGASQPLAHIPAHRAAAPVAPAQPAPPPPGPGGRRGRRRPGKAGAGRRRAPPRRRTPRPPRRRGAPAAPARHRRARPRARTPGTAPGHPGLPRLGSRPPPRHGPVA